MFSTFTRTSLRRNLSLLTRPKTQSMTSSTPIRKYHYDPWSSFAYDERITGIYFFGCAIGGTIFGTIAACADAPPHWGLMDTAGGIVGGAVLGGFGGVIGGAGLIVLTLTSPVWGTYYLCKWATKDPEKLVLNDKQQD